MLGHGKVRRNFAHFYVRNWEALTSTVVFNWIC